MPGTYISPAETGLYYLQSRYYAPELGRFINADAFTSTSQGFTGNNMFAYCGNNPVNYIDPTGEFFQEFLDTFVLTLKEASGYFAVAAGVSQADSPVPGPADVAAGAMVVGGLLVCTAISIYNIATAAPAKSLYDEKAATKSEAISITKDQTSTTIIYRYGGTNPGNLTPREKDIVSGTGLSFSTIPRPGSAVTTIEALNATGLVYAVQDGSTHVSVYPVGGTMSDWVNAGSGSIWTQAVKSVVVKWDGAS